MWGGKVDVSGETDLTEKRRGFNPPPFLETQTRRVKISDRLLIDSSFSYIQSPKWNYQMGEGGLVIAFCFRCIVKIIKLCK